MRAVSWWRRRARERAREEARESLARLLERRRHREEWGAAWRAAAPVTPGRIRAAYEERLAEVDERLRAWCRPVAAWALRDGEPSPTSSRMGGPPAMYPGEPWTGENERFWVQLNLAELAPYAQAYGIEMPSEGLVQVFGGPGEEQARYLPPQDLPRLELRHDIPLDPDVVEDAHERHHRTKLIDFYPEAQAQWQEAPPIEDEAVDAFYSEDLPGYSFGWWPFSDHWLEHLRQYSWPQAPDASEWVFLASCESDDDLALVYSDSGWLWANVPRAELARGDFTHLICDGESS